MDFEKVYRVDKIVKFNKFVDGWVSIFVIIFVIILYMVLGKNLLIIFKKLEIGIWK